MISMSPLGFIFFFKSERAALGNGAQIIFQLFPGHAASIIRYGKGGVTFFVDSKGNGEIIPGKAGDIFT